MATSDEEMQPRTSGRTPDILVQFRWFLIFLALDLFVLVSAVVADSVFGYPVFGGLMAAFALLSGSIILFVGVALFAYRELW